jgi:Tfp pilus assembly protein PilX
VSSVKLRGAPRDGGASLLMVLFAVVFVAGIISLLVTLLDGGMRQSASLNQTQATRLAGGSALQAAESIVANTTYSSPASVPCLNGGTISYTDPVGRHSRRLARSWLHRVPEVTRMVVSSTITPISEPMPSYSPALVPHSR